MPSSLELSMDDFDSVYHNIQDSFDSFHEFGTGYIADMSKNQFDTDRYDLSPYLAVPAFDTSLSGISSGLSSYPSSHVNTPVNGDPESSAAGEDGDMDSDYDVEHLSLSGEKKHTVIGHATYATSNVSERVFKDMPYVPPASPAHPQAPVRSQRRRTQTKVAIPVYISDEDADFESEGGDATEDEYIPTPPLNPLKRRRSVETTVSSFGSVSQSPSYSRPAKQQRTSRGGRNIQASGRRPQPEDWTTEDDEKWRCQHWPCDHRQWNRRGPDFRRHQRTHTRESPYVCWGVELEHAAESTKPIPGPTDKIRGIPVEYKAVMRIGGCFETFSRLDALKRHLEKTKTGKKCATDFNDFRGALDD